MPVNGQKDKRDERKPKNLVGFRTHERQDHGQKPWLQGIRQMGISLNPALICYDLESEVNSSCFSRAKVAFPAPLENKSITSKFAEDFCNCNSFWNSSIFADVIFFCSCFCNYSNFMGFDSQLQQFQWFTSLPSTWPAPTCPYATAHIVPGVVAPPVQPRPLTAWQISLQKLPPLKYLQYSYYSYSSMKSWDTVLTFFLKKTWKHVSIFIQLFIAEEKIWKNPNLRAISSNDTAASCYLVMFSHGGAGWKLHLQQLRLEILLPKWPRWSGRVSRSRIQTLGSLYMCIVYI